MINFTVGPVQMDGETRAIGGGQIPYFRTPEFSAVMRENERLLCTMFGAPEGSRAVFLTGSGTAGMEGGIMNFFSPQDRVLVVNGGSFGHRLVELCQIHGIPFTEIALEAGKPLLAEHLARYEGAGYTGMALQLCETSTGVLYDMELAGGFCRRNGLFLFVDAVSGFLADRLSMENMHINAVVTGSQKALALPPGMSFTVLDAEAQRRCTQNNVRSLYFCYAAYLKDGERGQTPFTPAVGTLLQLNEKLRRIQDAGGIEAMNRAARERAEYFRARVAEEGLPLRMFTAPECSSNCVTALMPTKPGVDAHRIFEVVKDEYGIWVCPNAGDLAQKVFRVGHIGCIRTEEIDRLVDALKDLVRRGLL